MTRSPYARRHALGFAFAAILGLSIAAVGVLSACTNSTSPSSPGASPATAPAPTATAGPVALDHLALSLQQKWSGLSQPLYLTNAGDGSGRIFIVEQTGRVRVVVGGKLQAAPYLDVHTLVSTDAPERGLLGLAFSPTFASDGRVYLDYTDTSGNTVVCRYTAGSPSSSAPQWSAPVTLLHIAQPYPNHNGGCLQFGPDGYLYIGMGDGGSGGDPGNRAQTPTNLLGKILRIDPSTPSGSQPYAIPPGNPSNLTTDPKLKPAPEVWSTGMRNPWRFSFDSSTGEMWIADVGQDAWEEIDVVTSAQADARAKLGGLNFGWHLYEGDHTYPAGTAVQAAQRSSAYVWPIYTYPHPLGESITGGYVYRGSAYPALVGTYVFADYVKGWVAGVRLTAPDGSQLATPQEATLLSTPGNPASFGVDENRELYLVDHRGAVYQVQARSK
jgi:glucose/arabinose dehydrogenase